jgi:hypothetical protein
MEYKIEKNIPIKKPTTCTKYPFSKMSVGDSFIISKEYSRQLMAKYANAARNFGRVQKPIMKFSTRKVEGGAIRVWRVE